MKRTLYLARNVLYSHVHKRHCVQAVIIPEGGHHLDLFFANDADPASVTEARRVEVENMHKWVSGYHARRRARAEQEVAYAGVRSAEL